jgi:molybdopterin molybdotransferase
VLSHRDLLGPPRFAFPDARRAILAVALPLDAETVSLLGANGRVASRTLLATEDIVPFARSAMDGYALRSAETRFASAGAPYVVRIASTTYAGDAASVLPEGYAIAIGTGAPLPDGADAVVPFEEVRATHETIALRAPLGAGDHVFAPGDDAKSGDVLVRAGDIITPGRAALLASAGYATLAVYRRPRVAIVSTGNELVAIDERPRTGQVRNSNAALLAACVERDGAQIVFLEHARDSEAPLRATLRRAAAGSDLVITTGGASAGVRDLVKDGLRAVGAKFVFDSIALRPAKPTAFAQVGAVFVAVLPGNPAAAYVAYAALIRGVVRRLAGDPNPFPAALPAELDGSVHRKEHRHFLLFGTLSIRDGTLTARPLENQCSSLVWTAAHANALIVVEPGSGSLHAGDAVRVEVTDWNAVPISDSANARNMADVR